METSLFSPVAVNKTNSCLTDTIESLKLQAAQLKESLTSVAAMQTTLAEVLKGIIKLYAAVTIDSLRGNSNHQRNTSAPSGTSTIQKTSSDPFYVQGNSYGGL